MSILVRNVEMPKDCRECRLMEYYCSTGETWCKPADGLLAEDFKPIPFDGRPEWCPLIEIPDKHGRIIDYDKLLDGLNNPQSGKTCGELARECIIIEAEGAEE